MANSTGKGAAVAAPNLAELAKRIRTLNESGDQTALAHALEIGALLNQAKPQVPHGQWEKWVRETLGMARNISARNMRLAANVQTSVHFKSIDAAERALRKPSKPKPAQDRPEKKPPREAGKRLRGLRMLDESKLLNARINIMKMVGILESIDLPELDLRGADPDTIAEIHAELSILSRWLDLSLDAVGAEMDDLRKQATIRKLREGMAGRTPAEVATATRLAEKLERKRYALQT